MKPGHKRDSDVAELWGEKVIPTRTHRQKDPPLRSKVRYLGVVGEGAKEQLLPSKLMLRSLCVWYPNQGSEKITKLFADPFKEIAPPSL